MIIETSGAKEWLKVVKDKHGDKEQLMRDPASTINIFIKPTNSIHKMTILATYDKESGRGKVFQA